MTEYETLQERLFPKDNSDNHVKNFDFTLDKQALAEKLGGKYTPGDFGILDGEIDWANSLYTAEERQEYIAKSINHFMEAAEDPQRSRRLSSTTDEWGNILDPAHIDYQTEEERIKHALWCREKFPERNLKSRYEWSLVLTGKLEPLPGFTVEDYQKEYDEMQQERNQDRLDKGLPVTKIYPFTDPNDFQEGVAARRQGIPFDETRVPEWQNGWKTENDFNL